jgi:hypothetical protein
MKYYMFDEETGNENKKKLNKSKIIKLIIFVLVIAAIATLTILYRNNEDVRNFLDKYIFRKEVQSANLVKIDLETNKSAGVYAYEKYILVLEQNSLDFYNRFGNKDGNLDIQISTPLFASKGNYLCVAEKNGQKLYCIQNKNIVWQKDIEGEIKGININKNGYVSVIVSGTSYKSIIEIYDNNGKELFKRGLSTTTVIDTDISADNKYLAIAETNFSGVLIQSTIEIVSMENAAKKPDDAIVYKYDADSDNLVTNIEYQKDNLVCMYDKYIDIIKNKNVTKVFDYTSEDVLFAGINLNSKIIKVLRKSKGFLGKEFQMKIIDTNNPSNEIVYEIEQNPKGIYVSDNIICINLGTEVLFVNSTGWLMKRYKSSQEVQNIVFNSNIAGIISKNRIELISL